MAIDFKRRQAEFAAYIRDPLGSHMPEGMDPQRMQTYRELFFNNIDSFLSSNFPVLKQLLSAEKWKELTEDFYGGHRCQTPYFCEIAEEFLTFLQNRQNSADYPFLLELAHYEWVEMALSISKEQLQQGNTNFCNEFQQTYIALSPLAWPLVYQYPVNLISPKFLPTIAPEQPTYLIVYRDQDDCVHFLQSTALTFRMLQILEGRNIRVEECLSLLVSEVEHFDPEIMIEQGVKILQEMIVKGIVIQVEDA